MSTNTALEQIKTRAEKFADLCPDYMYRAIRHLERNCDVECEAAEEDENHVCNHPDRYEGEDMAKVLADVPKLLAALEAVEEVAQQLEATYPSGGIWSTKFRKAIEEALR